MPDLDPTFTRYDSGDVPEQRTDAVIWAEVAHGSRVWHEAEKRWLAVRHKFPSIFHGWRRGAEVLVEQGRPDEATTLLESAPAIFAEDANRLHDLARLAERRQDWVMMEHWWRRFLFSHPEPSWAYGFLAVALREQGRHAEADHVLERAQQARPQDAELFVEHARLAERRGDLPAALQRWRTVTARFPDRRDAYAATASILRQMERWDEAEAVLQDQIDRAPEEPELRLELLRLVESRRNWDRAVTQWTLFREQFPTDARGWVGGARALMASGADAAAETLIDAARPKFSGDWGVAVMWAEYPTRRREWREALRRWTAVRKRFPDEPRAWSEEGRAIRELGDGAQAEAVLAEARERFPADFGLAAAWADLPVTRSDPKETLTRWSQVSQVFSQEARVHVEYARALRANGQDDEAEAAIDRACAKFPNSRDLVFAWADAPAQRGDHAEAARRWTDLRDRFQDDIQVYVALAASLQSQGRAAEAEQVLQEAIGRFPNDLGVATQHAASAERRGDKPEALRRWQDCVARFPRQTAPYTNLARLLIELDRHEDAEQALAAGIREVPEDINLLIEHAKTAEGRFAWPEALSRWQDMQSLFPDAVQGYVGYALVLRRMQRFADAETVLVKAQHRFPNDLNAPVELARTASMANDWPAAAERWQQVATRFPAYEFAYTHLADALSELRRFEDADAAMASGLAAQPNPDNSSALLTIVDRQASPQFLVFADSCPSGRLTVRWAGFDVWQALGLSTVGRSRGNAPRGS